MDEKRLANRVISLLREFAGESVVIGPETSLGDDLGMDGDDADDFMIAFAKEFEVDLHGFVFERYFGAEASSCLPLLPWQLAMHLYRALTNKRDTSKEPLLVKDLIRAAREKKWVQRSQPDR